MSGGSREPATRSSVVRLRRRLDQVRRGAAMLRRKRESLVAELFTRARPAIDSRALIDEQAALAYRELLRALATRGRDGLTPLGWPTREVRVELEPVDTWGLHAMDLAARPAVVRTLEARAVVPGPSDVTAVEAARQFERLIELVVDAAPKEFLMRRLGHELARATRLVNTLEQRVMSGLSGDLLRIRRTLEEREREEHQRLKHLAASRARAR